jgi:hypothetical protein
MFCFVKVFPTWDSATSAIWRDEGNNGGGGGYDGLNGYFGEKKGRGEHLGATSQ